MATLGVIIIASDRNYLSGNVPYYKHQSEQEIEIDNLAREAPMPTWIQDKPICIVIAGTDFIFVRCLVEGCERQPVQQIRSSAS